jgi:hypothetical protein
MNNNGLEQTLERLRAEQAEDEAQLTTLQRRVLSRQKAIEGLEGLVDLARAPVAANATEDTPESVQPVEEPPSPRGQDEDRPRSAEAIRRVLVETERPWTAKAMTEELLRRGWAPKSTSPEDAVRTAMSRAGKAPDNGIVRLPDGSYMYRPEEDSLGFAPESATTSE